MKNRTTVMMIVLLLLFVSFRNIICVDPTVIMYLDFENVVNGVAKDKSGMNHDCTFENGATTADAGGKYGKAARFGVARDDGRLNCGIFWVFYKRTDLLVFLIFSYLFFFFIKGKTLP